jgi:hypothetical protein
MALYLLGVVKGGVGASCLIEGTYMAKKKAAKKTTKQAGKASKKKVTKKRPAKAKAAEPKAAPKKKTPVRRVKEAPKRTRVEFVPEVVVPGLTKQESEGALPEVAFYYPNPYWRNVDWVKNIILFFDGIGMLIPNYMEESARFDDEAVIAGLKEHNLFHVFQPETFLDQPATERLEQMLLGIIESGTLDDLPRDTQFQNASLSMSRMGFHVAEDSAKRMFEALKKRNLADETRDGVSIPMHQSVRYLILMMLGQILRVNGKAAGFDLLPATDVPQLVESLVGLLKRPTMPSADHVIALDLEAVGVDLGSVAIDEILDYRKENRDAYRKYARQLRLVLHDLSLMPPDVQALKLEERQAVISDLAADLRKCSRNAWKKPASFLFSFAGAAWRAYRGDPIGGALAGGSAVAGFSKGESADTEAFSYLFNAAGRFSW